MLQIKDTVKIEFQDDYNRGHAVLNFLEVFCQINPAKEFRSRPIFLVRKINVIRSKVLVSLLSSASDE
jgi:hypothetical protein